MASFKTHYDPFDSSSDEEDLFSETSSISSEDSIIPEEVESDEENFDFLEGDEPEDYMVPDIFDEIIPPGPEDYMDHALFNEEQIVLQELTHSIVVEFNTEEGTSNLFPLLEDPMFQELNNNISHIDSVAIYINGQNLSNLHPTRARNLLMANELHLREIEWEKINENRFEFEYNQLAFPPDRMAREDLNTYGQRLQVLLDNFFRAETNQISSRYLEELQDHMANKPNDYHNYILRYTNSTNRIRSSMYVTLSFNQIHAIQDLNVREAYAENRDYVGSNQVGLIIHEETIDVSIVGYVEERNRARQAGFFPHYHTMGNNNLITEELRKMQIFSPREINAQQNDSLYTHCVINSLMYFQDQIPNLKEILPSCNRYFKNSYYSPLNVITRLSTIINLPISVLHIDSKTYKITCTIYERDTTMTGVSIQNALQNIICLGLFENHAFPIFECQFSKMYIKAVLNGIDVKYPLKVCELPKDRKIRYSREDNPVSNYHVVILLSKLGQFIPLTSDQSSKIIKNKRMMFLANQRNALPYEIFDEDIKLCSKVKPASRVFKLDGELKEGFDKFFQKMTPDKLKDEKKILDGFKYLLKDTIRVPKSWESVADFIVYADTETYPTKNGTIKPHSIDYICFAKEELRQYVEQDSLPENFESRIKNFWGPQQYIIIPEGATIVDLNPGVQLLSYQNRNYSGFKINDNIFYLENTSCIEMFLNRMNKISKPGQKIDIYFHNAKYDTAMFSFVKQLRFTEKNTVMKDGKVYSQGLNFKGTEIRILDTYKMIQTKLENFPKQFGFKNIEKEYMPYQIYTEETVLNPIVSFEKLKSLYNDKEINGKSYLEFIEHVKNVCPKALDNNQINLKTYSIFYSKLDVLILAKGHIKWGHYLHNFKFTPSVLKPNEDMIQIIRQMHEYNLSNELEKFINKFCNLLSKKIGLENLHSHCLYNYLTSAAFADADFIYGKCYEGVYNITASVHDFCQLAVYGGQTMTSLNKPHSSEVEGFNLTPSKEYLEDYKNIKNKEDLDLFHLKYYGNYLSDYDGVSMYPSAMSEMDGYIRGKPVKFTPENIEEVNKCKSFKELEKLINSFSEDNQKNSKPCNKHFFFVCKFNSSGADSIFPLFRNHISDILPKTKYDNFQWTNMVAKREMVLDKYGITNIMKRHKLELGVHFTLTYGIYFPEGYNPIINDFINNYKTKRDEFKKAKNPLQAVIKLIMNSGYGKTLVKPPKDNLKFFDGTHQEMIDYAFQKKICPSVHLIMSNIDGKGKNQYLIATKDDGYTHKNRAHIGASILSYSKIILSRPILIADSIWRFTNGESPKDSADQKIHKVMKKWVESHPEHKKELYMLKYCDTDSMMGSCLIVYLIKKFYKKIYGVELDGEEFGQFHIDFVMSNPNLVNIFGIKDVFKNKKEYCIVLQGFNPKTEEFEYEEKITFKGLPHSKIIKKAKEEFPDDPFPVYRLFSSNKLYKIPIVEEDDFKVRYKNKGSQATKIKYQEKDLNLLHYENTYDRFIDK